MKSALVQRGTRVFAAALITLSFLLIATSPAFSDNQNQPLLAKNTVNAPDRPYTNFEDVLQREMARVMEKIEGITQDAEISKDEKKLKIVEYLRSYRYGDDQKETFFISDIRGNLIMNPLEPEKEGSDLRGMQDANGKLFFAEFIRIALQEGGGFIDYMYADEQGGAPKPQVAMVTLLKDFGWVLGTGLVREMIAAYEIPVFAIPLPPITPGTPI